MMHITMHGIQEAERRGRRRRRWGPPLVVAALVAVVSMALAKPALAAGPPTVTNIIPRHATSAGGTSVTIIGINFSGATAVKFGTPNAESFTVNSNTMITAVSPPREGEHFLVDVTVTTPAGTSATSTADQFGYLAECQQGKEPVVTSIEPHSGPAGTSVTITGKRFFTLGCFNEGFSVQRVLFGFNEAAFTSPKEGEIVAVAPPGTGTVDVTVESGLGQSAVTPGDQFSYPAPTCTKSEPETGPAAGGTTVTITGTSFTGATAVKFGLQNATSFTVNSETSITAVSPPLPGRESAKVGVTVTTASGTSAITLSCRFVYEPVVESVRPRTGLPAGGTSVTIRGRGFKGIALPGEVEHGIWVQQVRFGTVPAFISEVREGEEITVTSPAGTGTVDVTVNTQGGTSGITPADQFTYVPAPTVTNVEPHSGPAAGGASVTITGTSFTGESQVKFGSEYASSVKVNSETSITAVSPAGTGMVDLTVTTPSGTTPTSEADRFTYGPTVTKVEPTIGPAAGGTSVTITGTGFSGATEVKFGSKNATSVKVNSETSIRAVSPAGTGTVDVTVTTPAGTSPTSPADQFTYGPTVTKVEPNRGSPGGGTTVTITGAGFTGATAVTFGSSPAKSLTVNSATSITAVSPKGKGTVDVTVTTPAGTSPTGAADQFTYSRK
jgi:hypothetical protein